LVVSGSVALSTQATVKFARSLWVCGLVGFSYSFSYSLFWGWLLCHHLFSFTLRCFLHSLTNHSSRTP